MKSIDLHCSCGASIKLADAAESTKIYALRENHFVRYVGKTSKSLEERLACHLNDARRGEQTYKCHWVRQMLLRGEIPRITLLEEVRGNGCADEIAWIKFFKDGGVDLVNGTDGGQGGIPTEAVRKKISFVKKGNCPSHYKGVPRPLQVRLKISASKMGHDVPAYVREKIRKTKTGVPQTPEAAQNIGRALAATNRTPAARERSRLLILNRVYTPAMHRNYSRAAKNRGTPPRKNGRWCKKEVV